jgi:hypothetical protein
MIPELEQLGFTRNEANVYLAALKLGKCSVQQLAIATGINRLTVHSIVEKFEAQQIFLRTYEGKRRRVTAVDPKQIKFSIERERESVERKESVLQSLLPKMEELFQRTQRGLEVKILQGEEGFKFIADDVLTSKTEHLEYANIDALAKVYGGYLFGNFLPRKHVIKLKTKFIYPDSAASHRYIEKNYLNNPGSAPMEVKFIPVHQFPFDDSLIVMYDDKIGLMKMSNMSTMIIRDKEFSSAFRALFYLFWEHSQAKVVRNY